MSPEERWSFREARELEVDAYALMREFLPDLSAEGLDLEAEHRDAILTGDGELFDRVIDEAGKRGEAWKHLAWYQELSRHAREERDMALFRSATSSIKIAARREFQRRAGGGADSCP